MANVSLTYEEFSELKNKVISLEQELVDYQSTAKQVIMEIRNFKLPNGVPNVSRQYINLAEVEQMIQHDLQEKFNKDLKLQVDKRDIEISKLSEEVMLLKIQHTKLNTNIADKKPELKELQTKLNSENDIIIKEILQSEIIKEKDNIIINLQKTIELERDNSYIDHNKIHKLETELKMINSKPPKKFLGIFS